MNTTHLHLLLNHFPVIGTLIGSGLLVWAIIKNQDNIKSIATALLALMAIITIPVYLTGEPAEESVEKLAGISASMIEMHEDAAGIAIWLMGATGIAAVMALFLNWQKSKAINLVYSIVFALSVMSFAAMARTGYYGGQIRHTELSSGNPQNQSEQGAGENQMKGEKEKDDD